MKRVDFDVDGTEIEGSDVDGAYVLYEEARQIEVDRDIKAANLKTLVDMVLAVEEEWVGETARWGDVESLFELARGLKQ